MFFNVHYGLIGFSYIPKIYHIKLNTWRNKPKICTKLWNTLNSEIHMRTHTNKILILIVAGVSYIIYTKSLEWWSLCVFVLTSCVGGLNKKTVVKWNRHLPVFGSQANPSPSNLRESSKIVTFQSVGVKPTRHLLICGSQADWSPSNLWESRPPITF